MKLSTLSRVFAATVLMIGAATTTAAANIGLKFEGAWANPSTFPDEPAVPYSHYLVYDTALGGSPIFYAAGSEIAYGLIAAHDFYGYSAAGITSLVLDTSPFELVFAVSDLVAPFNFDSAELWFDADISVATPTRMWMAAGPQPGSGFMIELGGQGTMTSYELSLLGGQATLRWFGEAYVEYLSEDMMISRTELHPVPVPGAGWLLGAGLAVLGGLRRATGVAAAT